MQTKNNPPGGETGEQLHAGFGPKFLRWVAWFLGFSALAKLITAAGASKLLQVSDPMLLITMRELLVIVAMLEIATMKFLLGDKLSDFQKGILLSWLSGCFLVYKALLWVRDPDLPCSCLGFLGKWLMLSERGLTITMTGIAVIMFAGGVAVAFAHLRNHQCVMVAGDLGEGLADSRRLNTELR